MTDSTTRVSGPTVELLESRLKEYETALRHLQKSQPPHDAAQFQHLAEDMQQLKNVANLARNGITNLPAFPPEFSKRAVQLQLPLPRRKFGPRRSKHHHHHRHRRQRSRDTDSDNSTMAWSIARRARARSPYNLKKKLPKPIRAIGGSKKDKNMKSKEKSKEKKKSRFSGNAAGKMVKRNSKRGKHPRLSPQQLRRFDGMGISPTGISPTRLDESFDWLSKSKSQTPQHHSKTQTPRPIGRIHHNHSLPTLSGGLAVFGQEPLHPHIQRETKGHDRLPLVDPIGPFDAWLADQPTELQSKIAKAHSGMFTRLSPHSQHSQHSQHSPHNSPRAFFPLQQQSPEAKAMSGSKKVKKGVTNSHLSPLLSPSKAGELRTQYLAESPPNVDNKKNSNNSDSDAAGFGRGGKGCPSSPKSATKRRSPKARSKSASRRKSSTPPSAKSSSTKAESKPETKLETKPNPTAAIAPSTAQAASATPLERVTAKAQEVIDFLKEQKEDDKYNPETKSLYKRWKMGNRGGDTITRIMNDGYHGMQLPHTDRTRLMAHYTVNEAFCKFQIKHHGYPMAVGKTVTKLQRKFRTKANREWYSKLKQARRTGDKDKENQLWQNIPNFKHYCASITETVSRFKDWRFKYRSAAHVMFHTEGIRGSDSEVFMVGTNNKPKYKIT